MGGAGGGSEGSSVVNAAHRGPSPQGPRSACGVWRAQGGEQRPACSGGVGCGGVLAVGRALTFLGQGRRRGTEKVLAERREGEAEEGCRTSRGDDVSSEPAAAAGWRRPRWGRAGSM